MSILFAFDRDWTVENPAMPGPVRLERLVWLQNETPHEVWAVGNQKLVGEAGIPGVEEMAVRLGIPRKKITKHFGDQFDRTGLVGLPPDEVKAEKRRRNVACKHKRLKILERMFPVQSLYIVIDDYPEVSNVGLPWSHLSPGVFESRWDEVHALALGEIDSLT